MTRQYHSTPKSLADVHEVLWSDVALLYQRWTTFRALYLDTSPEQREVLSWAAGGFFTLLHRVLIDDLLLGVARLGDPLATSGRANLVLASLLEHLPPDLDTKIKEDVARLVTEFQTAAAFARPVRNKRLAHRDLAVATGQSTELDYSFTWDQLDGALKLAGSALNLVENYYEGRTTMFTEFIHHKGADVLVNRLQTAKKDRDEYFRRKLGESE